MAELTEMLCDRVPLNKREAHEMARNCRIPASAVLPIAIGAEGWDAAKTGGMTPRHRQTRGRYGLDASPPAHRSRPPAVWFPRPFQADHFYVPVRERLERLNDVGEAVVLAIKSRDENRVAGG